MLPPTVNVPALTVIVRTVPPVTVEATAPVPRFKSFGPLKVTSAFQFCVGLANSVTACPLVFPNVPPLMVSDPTPSALLLFTLSEPALSVVPPE